MTATPEHFHVELSLVGRASPESVVLSLVARNVDAEPRTFCMYYVPFEGFLNDILEVLDAHDQKVGFSGPLASRTAPGPRSYVMLAPGEARTVRFELVRHYALAEGTYRIRTGNGVGTLPRSNQLTITVGDVPDERRRLLDVSLAADGGTMTLTVVNRSIDKQRFCRYHTPFEGIRNHFMHVLDADGREVRYIGMMAKRAAPTGADDITLAPGEAKTATFALSDGYAVKPGTYTARFFGASMNRLLDSEPVTVTI